MTLSGDDLVDQLSLLASDLGVALAPAGHDEVLQGITDLARSMFAAAACSLAVLDDDEEKLTFRVASGRAAEDVVGMSVPVGEGIAGWVVSSGQAVTIEEVAADPRFASEVAAATGYTPSAIHALPLQTERRIIGVIELLDPGAGAPAGQHGMELMALFARHAALAIEGAEVFAHLGRFLLGALASSTDGDLRAALEAARDRASRPEADLAELSLLFQELGRMDGDERAIATRIVTQFTDYVRSRTT